MRYLTTAAMALALAAGAVAASADTPPDKDKDHHAGAPAGAPAGHPAGGPVGGQGAHGGPPPAGPPGAGPGPAHRGPPVETTHTFNGQAPTGGGVHGAGQPGGAGNYHPYSRGLVPAPNGQGVVSSQAGRPPFHVGGQPVAPGGQVRGGIPGANHAPRARDAGRGTYNPSRFPQQFHAQGRFHVDWNNRPNGWYQRSWGYGDFLPFGWFAPAFYLDFQSYGLPYPPVGCEWVRQGPDAVLVDVWSGEVLSVAYGVFY
jgi:Ni/Co efflux regulator RcnB